MDLGIVSISIKINLNRVVQKEKSGACFSLNCFYKDLIVLLCSCFLISNFFSNKTDINVLDIIAVLFLSLAISIVGKISTYLKVQSTEYCAYCNLAALKKRLHPLRE